ncbi:MAG TPA: Holliday junction branch migration DNA helicase RuvB [Polyangiaceae bacterium]|nr:Holliday junction branch migration DNA helicase RuvB [Polyangiaceae bacterium]
MGKLASNRPRTAAAGPAAGGGDDSSESGRAIDGAARVEDAQYDRTLRPRTLSDYIGQTKHKDNLRVFVEAARRRGEPLDHLLLCGPPGLGKTTLAHILGHEMGVSVATTSGPAIEHKGALAALLTTRIQKNDILFVDEIHRLNSIVEESLYPALDDCIIDVTTGEGAFASAVQIPIQPFTLIGATTRTGLLTAPLFSRFGHVIRLDFYSPEDLARIVVRSAKLLGIAVEPDAALEIARRSRGTPRIANRLLHRVRDFAEVLGVGRIDLASVRDAAARLEVDQGGLDDMDRRYLRVIIDHYEGGPVGVDALAAALAEPRDTLEDVVEPFLVQQGYVGRTPRGRVANRKAYEALGREAPARGTKPQGELFED